MSNHMDRVREMVGALEARRQAGKITQEDLLFERAVIYMALSRALLHFKMPNKDDSSAIDYAIGQSIKNLLPPAKWDQLVTKIDVVLDALLRDFKDFHSGR